jgi:hypothetical protein
MDFAKQTLLPENPQLEDVDAAEACTNEFVDQLAEMGVLTELGIPGY